MAPTAPDGFVVHSFVGDDWAAIKDYVREKLRQPAWEPAPKETGEDILGRIAAKARASGEAQQTDGHEAKAGKVAAEYIYELADGTPYLQVRRDSNKAFKQRHWTGSQWAWGKPEGPKVPYRLPELLAADTVFIVEGEKDADALTERGIVATTSSEGAGKWTADLNNWFKGRTVYILPDNDKPGRDHARQVAENLHGIASEVRIVDLPGLPEKGDVSDWLEGGGDTATLVDLCKSAQLWEPSRYKDGKKGRPRIASRRT